MGEGRDGERGEEDGAEDKVTNDNANAADRDEEEDEAEKEAANGFMSNRRVVEMDDPSLVTTKSQEIKTENQTNGHAAKEEVGNGIDHEEEEADEPEDKKENIQAEMQDNSTSDKHKEEEIEEKSSRG